MNGSFYIALGRTLFEAFYGTVQVHKQLVTKRQREMRDRNKGRKDDVGEELSEGSKFLVYELKKADKGILSKLAAWWTEPHVLAPKMSTFT